MNRIQKILSSVAVTSLLMVAPLAASAATLNATGSTGVVISPNGIVRVIGAEVTSVSNGVVNAVTTLGSVVMNWAVDVSASTKIAAGGSKSATTTDIKAGDKISFAGSLSSSAGNSLTVAATKIRDITNFPPRHIDGNATSTVSVGKHDNDGDADDGTTTVNANTSASVHSDGKHGGLNFLGGLGLHIGKGN